MSNFVKKVLVAKGELERLQQVQLREYSSPVSHMGDLHTIITQVLGDKHMSAEVKRKLLATYQTQFDKLQRDTGLLSGTASASGASEVQNTKEKPTESEAKTPKVEPEEGEISDADDKQEVEDPNEITVSKIGIKPMYQQKASKLLTKITSNPDILSRNEAGEMVVFGKAEPGTDFNNLLKSMVNDTRDLKQPGMDKWLDALKTIGVKANELSGQELRKIYSPPLPRGTTRQQLAALKTEPSTIPKFEPPETTTASPSRSKRKPYAHTFRMQTGKGIKKMKPMPPGLRANILYVY